MSTGVAPAELSPDLKADAGRPTFGLSRTVPTELIDLGDYARQVIGSDELWRALVEAIGMDMPAETGRYWIVLADDPLLAVAGAAAIGQRLGRRILVPKRASERVLTPETFTAELQRLDYNERLDSWIAAATALLGREPRPASLLVRAWSMMPARFAAELAEALATGSRTAETGLVGLLRTADPEHARLFAQCTVLNLVNRRDRLVGQTIFDLGLPSHRPATSIEEATDLVRHLLVANNFREEALLQAMNTPAHHRFQRLALALERERRPETLELFKKTVLASDEDKARQSAVLFLVSHFERITAEQLIAMGDMLASQTPAAEPARDAARRPFAITDQVLDECDIKIMGMGLQGTFAVFTSNGEPLRLAESIRDLFQQEAALLKERYLLVLARAMTIGHPSTEIADTYVEMEAEATRQVAALDLSMAHDRLVRTVFSHPAIIGERQPDQREVNMLVQTVDRMIPRIPELAIRLSQLIPNFTADGALGAICSARPATLDKERLTLFQQWAAQIFWACYAHGVPGLSLRGYPALADRSGDAKPRREALVAVLRAALDDTATDSFSRWLHPQIGVSFLARLLAAIGRQKQADSMLPDDRLVFTLLTDVAANFLLRALPYRLWRDVATETTGEDLPLAQILLSQPLRDWLGQPRVRLAGLDAEEMFQENRRHFEVFIAVIEALVGNSSFGEAGEIAINIWLMSAWAMNLTPIPANITSSYFGRPESWAAAMHEQADVLGERFYQSVQPLLALMPLVVLMAVTRTGETPDGGPIFTFSEPLWQWLVEGGTAHDETPLKRLETMMGKARRFQTDWREAHDRWHISVGAPGRIVKAFKDRIEALRAFDRALKPCLEATRRNGSIVRFEGRGAPSPNIAEKPAGTEIRP